MGEDPDTFMGITLKPVGCGFAAVLVAFFLSKYLEKHWWERGTGEIDAMESPYKIVDLFFQSCERFCITLLTPHGGRHGGCCVTSCVTSCESPYDAIEQLRAGSQKVADCLTLADWLMRKF